MNDTKHCSLMLLRGIFLVITHFQVIGRERGPPFAGVEFRDRKIFQFQFKQDFELTARVRRTGLHRRARPIVECELAVSSGLFVGSKPALPKR